MTDDELREQLALSAVGALTDAEQLELDDVLRTRPDLQAELDELLDTAALLADAVPAAPPPALRTHLLELIASTPQLPRETRPPSTTASRDEHIAPVVPIASRRRNRIVGIVGAAAAVIALVVGVAVVAPWDDSGADPVAAVVDADDAVVIAMPGTGGSASLPGISIVHSASEDAAVLLGDDVPVPAGDRVYELWAVRSGTPERFATFRPDADGTLSVYAAGLDPASAEAWAITEEPAGGSDTPTLPILNATA